MPYRTVTVYRGKARTLFFQGYICADGVNRPLRRVHRHLPEMLAYRRMVLRRWGRWRRMARATNGR